jgi:hypothetical protein
MTRKLLRIALLLVLAACKAEAGPSVPQVPVAGIAGSAAPMPAAGGGGLNSSPPPIAAGGPAAAGGAAPQPPTAGSGSAGTAAPASCRGFSFEGLVYSPGGSVLPNTCEPFHATTNNPYAVRCVDAWPWYKTQFPGDNFCILPPLPDKGVQYGVHPQGNKWFEQVSKGDMSGYQNLSDEWTMKEGDEEQANYQTAAGNAMEQTFYRSYARMRPGSHHMIVSAQEGGTPETWGPATDTGLGAPGLPGAQRPDENSPKSLEKPAEDKGLFRRLGANAPVVFNMHHFNASGMTILKEAWTNLWWESDATVEVFGILGLNFAQVATLNIPAGATQDLHYSWNISQPIRLISTFGHRHAWTSNFSSWIENSDGKLDIIYQSFDWLDEPTYRYDSMTQNPNPAPAARMDGASSGIRMLMPGQKLHFNCHIEFTDERAAKVNGPAPAELGSLHFANEAFTAEMCILFGSTAAVQLSSPVADMTQLPDFATVD